MKLNGWQRMWIVLTAAWVLVVASLFVISQHSEETRYHDWANELLQYLIDKSDDLHGYTLVTARAAYSDLSDKQLVDALHEKYVGKHPAYRYGFAEIDAKYKRGKRAMVWLVTTIVAPPVFVYLVGLSVSWVLAGFKRT